MPLTLPERLERALRLTLLVFVLAAAAFLSAVTAIRVAIRGRIVAMPNVVGKSATDAENILNGERLRIRVADRIYDASPANTIVQQSPAPGEQIKVLEDAQVILSLGPQAVTIPVLEGQSARLARIALLQAGLQLGEVSTIYLPDTEPDIVLKQDPPAGSKAARPRVDLLLSGGPPSAAYVMPSVVGLDQKDAERLLSSAGLRIAKRTPVSDPAAAKGMVVAQKPSYGQRVDGDAAIELSIAD